LRTNLKEIENQIIKLGKENILCIYTTTSCFAPRAYDDVKEVSAISQKHEIYHLCNNAYGIYCTKIIDQLNQATKTGRLDIVISSTDKNFMVPVGGSLIYSTNEDMINKIKKNYPGRASMAPILDLFITLLEMGKDKYKYLIKDRKEKYTKLKSVMTDVANLYGEKIIDTPNNKISLAMSLTNICKDKSYKAITYLGSLFYSRQISGIKILAANEPFMLNGYKFKNYGTHCDNYSTLPYCAFAAGIGITEFEVLMILIF
jgi:O-phospho-L-seryl-tRNASec:L-selenocysteinyl-tRNA synthase